MDPWTNHLEDILDLNVEPQRSTDHICTDQFNTASENLAT